MIRETKAISATAIPAAALVALVFAAALAPASAATSASKNGASPKTVASSKTDASSKPSGSAATPSPAKAVARVGAAKSVGAAIATAKEPLPVSAGTPLVGWDQIGVDEWPAAGDAVIGKAKTTSVEVLRSPGDRRGALRLVQGRSMSGPIRLLGLGAQGEWVRVGVPIRPNGTAGWVRRDQLDLVRSTLRVVVDLSTNTLTVEDGGQTVVNVSVATGTGGTPTPTGLFFVKEIVPQANPGGSLGPVALGLSGFSDVLSHFDGGEATIAIHGTNNPGKLGSNVSHGCIRVDNKTIVALSKILSLGTPVEIVKKRDLLPPAAFRKDSAWISSFGLANELTKTDDTSATDPVPVVERTSDAIPSPDPLAVVLNEIGPPTTR